MEIYGLRKSVIAGFQQNFPANNYMLLFIFNGTPPSDFNTLPFTKTYKSLVQNCVAAHKGVLNYPDVFSCNLSQAASLIKFGDLIANYNGETCSYYIDGVASGSVFPQHVVYAPQNIDHQNNLYGEYSALKTFEACMYKQSSDAGYTPQATFMPVNSNDDIIEYDYGRTVSVDFFAVNQGTAANTYMRNIAVEYFDGTNWLPVLTTPTNVGGFQLHKFNAVTASKFRARKIVSGAAGTVQLGMMYFGSTVFDENNLYYQDPAPTYAIAVPDFVSTTLIANLQAKLADGYGRAENVSEYFFMLMDASTIDGKVILSEPDSSQPSLKFNYNLINAELF